MEIRTLRYFLAVAREENMTKAAEILHVTQPTLSKALRSLEEELGKKLFIRHSFSISLTDEGILLKARAEDLVRMADKIEQEFVSLDDITGGDLYLGLAESVQIQKLAHEIRILKNLLPNLHYHITSGDTEQVIEKLNKGLLDFAVLAETPDYTKYEAISFPSPDLWGLIVRTDSLLAKKKKLKVRDLKNVPLFCSEQGWHNEIAMWAGEFFQTLTLEGSFKLSYNASLFVKEGLGCLLTFKGLIDTSEDSGLVFIPLDPPLETTLYLTWNKYQSFTPVAERFLAQVQKSFAR